MRDWNVLVSVRDEYQHVRRTLEQLGSVSRTDFYNVLVMQVPDPASALELLAERLAADERLRASLARFMPVTRSFAFQDPEEFEGRAKEALLPWLPDLAGKTFHVRIHRRGFKGRLSSHEEERLLAEFVLEKLEEAGTPGQIAFEDPDVIVAIETIGQRAGLAFCTREDLQKYPFLKVD